MKILIKVNQNYYYLCTCTFFQAFDSIESEEVPVHTANNTAIH